MRRPVLQGKALERNSGNTRSVPLFKPAIRGAHFNATVFAVTVYGAFGFRVAGPETARNGIAFSPMTLKI
ncbi:MULTISPECIES: GNAT family N-acetyltransferase [Ralstonia solanacearum species complex]|uniref:GNAT family N-acetyltransferase n=1 Tax=Ralstonia solanacearum species complex TaxID=3116862 RepID=UPI00287063F1|nr:GNAT family N-acetyltransferase [Ralstonia solanacearum]